MILMGLNMTGKFPILRHLTLRPPKFLMKALQRVRRKANADETAGESSLATPIMFGSLTGLMPCGPLQAAQLAAAGTGSIHGGAVAMLGFYVPLSFVMDRFFYDRYLRKEAKKQQERETRRTGGAQQPEG